MDEKNLLEDTLIVSQLGYALFGSTSLNDKWLPKIETLEDFIQQESLPIFMWRIYQTSPKVLNYFLDLKFSKSINDFRRMYAETHFKALGANISNEELDIIINIHNIPQKIICCLARADDAAELSYRLANYQQTITEDCFGKSQLNLHNDDVGKFTLIRANFDLEAEKNKFYFGYHFSTEKFKFFIKSSLQFDLTIVYQEI